MSRAPDSLVSTKLCPSQTRPKLVARPRLTARLEREAGRKPTLVCAPAGFGKTTLLVEWLKGRQGGERSVAWLSLHEGDNNLARFLLHLVAALRTVEEGVGEGVLAVRCARPSLHALTPWQARWPEDPWRACLEAARLGSDWDTIGAITGALMGACAGVGAFPTEKIAEVKSANGFDLEDKAQKLLLVRERCQVPFGPGARQGT